MGQTKQLQNSASQTSNADKTTQVTTLPVIIYDRVSRFCQDENLDTRIDQLQAFATSLGYHNKEIIIDRNTGPGIVQPGIDQLMQLAKGKKIVAVIFYSLAKFGGHSLKETLVTLKILNQLGVKYYSLSESKWLTDVHVDMWITYLQALRQEVSTIAAAKAKLHGKVVKAGRIPVLATIPDEKVVAEFIRYRSLRKTAKAFNVNHETIAKIVRKYLRKSQRSDEIIWLNEEMRLKIG